MYKKILYKFTVCIISESSFTVQTISFRAIVKSKNIQTNGIYQPSILLSHIISEIEKHTDAMPQIEV